MEEFKCAFCGRFIGKEVAGKLYDRKNNLISETEVSGYCLRCRNYTVWRPSGLMSIQEAEIPQAEMLEVTPAGISERGNPHKPNPKPDKPEDTGKPEAKPERVPASPVFVTFGNSKIYHMVNHFEDKAEQAKVITDTTGYRLCKICDGFVEGMNE